ncbi:hypothetical protein F5Y10DRAFT_121331 [Nemania abortiva]|nr:hypothetical protein F5Y10DRAFT_121331 [Nemania abortiva]
MANLPSQHPHLAIHLTDRALTPLITSARGPDQIDFLTSLSHTALSAHESAQRLGLGVPQRIMVEHGEGPVLLQTFLNPHATPAPTTTGTPSLRDEHSVTPSASGAPGSRSTSATNGGGGGSQHPLPPPSPSPAHAQAPRPHQGALALAAESRANPTTATTTTTTTAYLRGGAAAPEHDEGGPGSSYPMFFGDEVDLDGEDENPDAPPMLVGVVIAARSEETLEARRAAAKLEHVGREIQGQWSADAQGQGQSQSPTPRGRGRADERQGDAAVD